MNNFQIKVLWLVTKTFYSNGGDTNPSTETYHTYIFVVVLSSLCAIKELSKQLKN